MEEVVNFIRDRGLDLTVDEVKASMTSAFDVYAIMRCITRRFPDSRVMPLWDKYIYSALDYLGLNMDISPARATLPAWGMRSPCTSCSTRPAACFRWLTSTSVSVCRA